MIGLVLVAHTCRRWHRVISEHTSKEFTLLKEAESSSCSFIMLTDLLKWKVIPETKCCLKWMKPFQQMITKRWNPAKKNSNWDLTRRQIVSSLTLQSLTIRVLTGTGVMKIIAKLNIIIALILL